MQTGCHAKNKETKGSYSSEKEARKQSGHRQEINTTQNAQGGRAELRDNRQILNRQCLKRCYTASLGGASQAAAEARQAHWCGRRSGSSERSPCGATHTYPGGAKPQRANSCARRSGRFI